MPLPRPHRDERDALRLDDLASALDAGLTPAQLGAPATAQDEQVLAALGRARGAALESVDAQVLEAAWTAGRGPAALRRLAEQRRQRATFTRELVAALRYPALLLALSALVSLISLRLGSSWVPWVGLGLSGAAVVGAIAVWRGVRTGGPAWLALPLVGEWARALGEVPYLEILHSLYASGVGLREAHARAAPASPIAAVRARLLAADVLVQSGGSLTEALTQANPVDHETLTLIATGERTGGLEEALENALRRRRFVAQSRAQVLGKALGSGAFLLAVGIVFAVVLSFYSSYFGMLRH
ncbi:MAG: type II secretion system F family protein [Planctomycetota bacterium]